MDTPQSAVEAIEHAKWQKQQEKRHTSEYLKYKLINLNCEYKISIYLTEVS